MATLGNAAADLETAFRQLEQRWEATKALWNDPVRWAFEREYWAPLEEETRAADREMERLGQVIAQARRAVK